MKENFYEYITNLIKDEKELIYEWGLNNSEITFKKNNPGGFDITVNYDASYIYLFTDRGYHNQFTISNNFNDVLTDVLAIVRDLLTKNIRIREYLSNSKPYKWELEYYINNKWNIEDKTTLIF